MLCLWVRALDVHLCVKCATPMYTYVGGGHLNAQYDRMECVSIYIYIYICIYMYILDVQCATAMNVLTCVYLGDS